MDHASQRELSLQELLMTHPILWARVRQLAVRGSVPHPEREPVGTAIPGLFVLIESNDGPSVVAALEKVGWYDEARGVEEVLKRHPPITST